MSTAESDLVERNVVLMPGPAFREAIRLSGLLSDRFGTQFVLDANHRAHLSLYQAAYPSRNSDDVVERVRAVAVVTDPVEVVLRGFGDFWGTFVFWEAEKSRALTDLHMRLVTALNPLREGRLLPIHQQLLADDRMPGPLRESIRQYGHPLSGDQERPHMTLARLKDSARTLDALSSLSTEQPEPVSFRAEALYLTEVGPHGTCPRYLRAFHFRQ